LKKPVRNLLLYLILSAATIAVYAQTGHFAFVNFDDPDYVGANFHVRAGLTWESIAWAFGSGYAGNWIPLTWISHMADCQFFGLRSGLHHLTSVTIHVFSVWLLFAALNRMTAAPWPSAFVAFIFGTHPLHVESVAWIAERKDVLSAFFWILTLWNYARYAERPALGRYLLVALTFCLGLLSKPMTVTLPFVLLLLDVWPLRRAETTAKLVKEKAPLFALSVCASVITFIVQRRGGAVIALDSIPVSARIENALISYVTYLAQFFRPVKLAVFYPWPDAPRVWEAGIAVAALAGISAAAWRWRRESPWFLSGWLWYLGTLVPAIGLVQVGAQAHADRYTYIPLIGISIMLAWSAADIVRRWPGVKPIVSVVAVMSCCSCVVAGSVQAAYWRDSPTLFRHAIEVTSGNYEAWSGLGLALKEQGRVEEAAADYRQAIAIRPQFADAQNNLGEALLMLGRSDEAVAHISEALRLQPASPEAHVNLGAALQRLGRIAEARAQYVEALSIRPESAAAHTGLAAVFEDQGRKDEALRELNEAVTLNPDYAPAHYNLGRLLGAVGRPGEAAAQFTEAIRLQPRNPANHYNLGIAFANQGRLTDAVAEFRNAIAIDPGYAAAHFNLGNALARLGQIDEAIAQFSETLRIRPDFVEARQNLETALALRGKAPG
jgi:tetratricopeptide (TPR) repeat protein